MHGGSNESIKLWEKIDARLTLATSYELPKTSIRSVMLRVFARVQILLASSVSLFLSFFLSLSL